MHTQKERERTNQDKKKTLILRRHTSGARYAATNTGIGRSDGPLDSRHAGQDRKSVV